MSIKILSLLRNKKYFGVFLISTVLMLIVYPVLQSFGQPGIWLQVIEAENLLLYIFFSILFGFLIMLQASSLKEPKKCRAQSGGVGTAGTAAGFFIAQCPTCAVLLSLFLPFDLIVLITTYNIWLTLGTIVLMLLAIHLLGGFRRIRSAS